MKNIWFTSDWHLEHENIIKLCNRPFANVREMNETIIGNFNDTVKDDDIVYNLGDVLWSAMSATIRTIKKVEMYCLRGNHDASNAAYFGRDFDDYLEVSARSKLFVLFHYPIEDWNGRYKGSIHLHGHTHGQLLAKGINDAVRSGEDTRHKIDETKLNTMPNRFDVSVECTGYKPIHIDEILSRTV